MSVYFSYVHLFCDVYHINDFCYCYFANFLMLVVMLSLLTCVVWCSPYMSIIVALLLLLFLPEICKNVLLYVICYVHLIMYYFLFIQTCHIGTQQSRCLPALAWRQTDVVSKTLYFSSYLEFRTMAIVHKHSNSEFLLFVRAFVFPLLYKIVYGMLPIFIFVMEVLHGL
jgi:hypothetical protein